MSKLLIAFGCALAVHAAGVVTVAALGRVHGASARVDALGRTIDVEQVETAAPVIHDEELAPVKPAASEKRSSRGTPSAPAALVARASTASSATADLPIDPAPTQTPDAQPAPVRFKLRSGTNGGGSPRALAGTSAASGEVALEADVSERARQIGGVAPRYPSEAVAQGVELASPLLFEIVVDESGRVVQTRALRHAGYGFDEAALAALHTYRFTPAKRNGRAVAVRMTWTVDFHFD